LGTALFAVGGGGGGDVVREEGEEDGDEGVWAGEFEVGAEGGGCGGGPFHYGTCVGKGKGDRSTFEEFHERGAFAEGFDFPLVDWRVAGVELFARADCAGYFCEVFSRFALVESLQGDVVC